MATATTVSQAVARPRSQGRLFFTLLPTAMFIAVIVGFAPT